MTPDLVDTLNLAVTILGGLTGFGGIVWIIRRMQAEIRDLRTDFHQLRTDLRDIRADFRQFRDENARQHEYLTDRIDRLFDSRTD